MASVKGLTEEVREALTAAAPEGLTTAELVERCSCADSAQAVSKILYAMRQSGEVASIPNPNGEGRNVHVIATDGRKGTAKRPVAKRRKSAGRQAPEQGGTDLPPDDPKPAPQKTVVRTAYRLSEHLDQLALDAEDVIVEALSRDAEPDLIKCLVTAQGAIHRAALRALIQEFHHHV